MLERTHIPSSMIVCNLSEGHRKLKTKDTQRCLDDVKATNAYSSNSGRHPHALSGMVSEQYLKAMNLRKSLWLQLMYSALLGHGCRHRVLTGL